MSWTNPYNNDLFEAIRNNCIFRVKDKTWIVDSISAREDFYENKISIKLTFKSSFRINGLKVVYFEIDKELARRNNRTQHEMIVGELTRRQGEIRDTLKEPKRKYTSKYYSKKHKILDESI